jgi:trk system potassium uptake protein TrkA
MAKKSFMVIGLGRFGLSVAKELAESTKYVIGVDMDETRVALASQEIENVLVGDCTKKRVLEELGVHSVDHAIVAIGKNLNATILTTINLKELGVKRITVRLDDSEYIDVMKRLGATEVIVPEEDAGKMFAKQSLSDNVLDYYAISKDYAVVQMKVNSSFEEVSLKDLNARNLYDINIVGIIRNDKFFLPKAEDVIKAGDVVLVAGKNLKINKFDKKIND